MPNVGHFWTPEEEQAALSAVDYEEFSRSYPEITPHAYRLRRGALLRAQEGLHAELLSRNSAPTYCKICAFLATLPPVTAKEWRDELALKPKVISHTAVVSALQERQVYVSEAAVRRHRRNHLGR